MVIRDWLSKCPLIAILRGIQSHEVEDVFSGLLAAGVAIAPTSRFRSAFIRSAR